jgi:probable HAF family extracellular repeat protein
MKAPFQALTFTPLGSALLGSIALVLATPVLLAAPGGGKGKPGGGDGGGEDPPANYDTVTTIPMPDGVNEYYAWHLNGAGQTVGGTRVKGGRFDKWGSAFLWTGAETVTLPNPPGHAYGYAYDIADNGLICGSAGTDAARNSDSNVSSAVWWAGQPGSFTTGNWNDFLPEGTGYRLIWADHISSDGEFVVFTADDPEWYNVFAVVGQVILNEAGIPTGFANLWLIDTIDGVEGSVTETWAAWGNLSLGAGLNELGENIPMVRVCGWYALRGDFGSAGPFGFVWELDVNAGTTSTIDLNPYPAAEDVLSEGNAVNGKGEIAFRLADPAAPNGAAEGYYWSGDTETAPVFLGNPGTFQTIPRAIDDQGTVVGRSTYVEGNQFAFLWSASTGLQDLNSLVSTPNTLGSGYDINVTGQILVWGYSAEARGGRFMIVEPNGNW